MLSGSFQVFDLESVHIFFSDPDSPISDLPRGPSLLNLGGGQIRRWICQSAVDLIGGGLCSSFADSELWDQSLSAVADHGQHWKAVCGLFLLKDVIGKLRKPILEGLWIRRCIRRWIRRWIWRLIRW